MNLLRLAIILVTTSATSCRELTEDKDNLRLQGSPRRLRCHDEDLQRTLYWSPRKSWKHENSIQYQIQFSTLANKNYRNLTCYEDEARKNRMKTMVKSAFCKTAVAELIPWSYLRFRVRALYKTQGNNTEVMTKFMEKACKPILDESTYTAPEIQITEKGTDFLHLNFTIPSSLINSLNSLGQNFVDDFDIREEYCAIPGSKKSECNVSECEKAKSSETNGEWKEANGHGRLEPGQRYCVWGRYTSSYNEKKTSNISELQFTSTLSDDQSGRIALVVSICGTITFSIICLIVFRIVYRSWKKMKKMINGDLPKKMEDLKKEMGKKENPLFFTSARRIYDVDQVVAAEDLNLLADTDVPVATSSGLQNDFPRNDVLANDSVNSRVHVLNAPDENFFDHAPGHEEIQFPQVETSGYVSK